MAPQFFMELVSRVCFHRPVTAIAASSDGTFMAVATECFIYVLRLVPPDSKPKKTDRLETTTRTVEDNNRMAADNQPWSLGNIVSMLETRYGILSEQLESQRNRLASTSEGTRERGAALSSVAFWNTLTHLKTQGRRMSEAGENEPASSMDSTIRKSTVQPEVVAVRTVPNTVIQLQWVDGENRTISATDIFVSIPMVALILR